MADGMDQDRRYKKSVRRVITPRYSFDTNVAQTFPFGMPSQPIYNPYSVTVNDWSSEAINSSGTATVGTQTCPILPLNQACTSGLDKVLQNFKDLYLNGQDCDVTLIVKGRKFQAHKIILKCQSPVFENMFQHEMAEQKSGIVQIDDCDPEMFHHFLLYLYTGKLEELDCNGVIHLHYIGHKYGVEALAAICVQLMVDKMTVESFCEIAAVGLRHSEVDLIESVSKFFERNMKEIVAKDLWKDFFLDFPSEAHLMLKKGFRSAV